MKAPRRAGILLHPTSLPGPFGIGDLGPSAYRWVDFLADSGLTLWQVLPLAPTGFGDSPYQCLSDFAGNPLLISPELMAEEGLLTSAEMEDHPHFPEGMADYGAASSFKSRLFAAARRRLSDGSVPGMREVFHRFRGEERDWLDSYGLYLAIKRSHRGLPWWQWEDGLARARSRDIARARAELAGAIAAVAFEQFLFRRQWDALRAYARGKGITIVGDLPIYCALDSADVWSGRKYFQLDRSGRPTVTAGVPPDYFSSTGQLWGNPVFRWDLLRRERYAWWIRRVRAALRNSDLVRLDHFRGYVSYWAVPAGSATAEAGRWMPGPGIRAFDRLRRALGCLPFLAEDLGVITADVVQARDRLGLPGMSVLQFAFDGRSNNPYLPRNLRPRTVVYTGTHDNDTTLGWYRRLDPAQRKLVNAGRTGGERSVAWNFIRMAWESAADTAICPLQDALSLGGEARMNRPGAPSGNWRWRFRAADLTPDLAARLRGLNERTGRLPRERSAPLCM
ncbi:MAG: 4-alpha-glucanotransferase [Anaerolineales bacterium]